MEGQLSDEKAVKPMRKEYKYGGVFGRDLKVLRASRGARRKFGTAEARSMEKRFVAENLADVVVKVRCVFVRAKDGTFFEKRIASLSLGEIEECIKVVEEKVKANGLPPVQPQA